MATHGGKVLYLDTTQGRYVIHADGGIERTDMYHPPSGQWTLVGLMFTGRGGGSVALSHITPQWVAEHAGELDRWTVLDLDHGTHRQWGSRLRSIHFYDRPEDTNFYKYTREHLRAKVYRPF